MKVVGSLDCKLKQKYHIENATYGSGNKQHSFKKYKHKDASQEEEVCKYEVLYVDLDAVKSQTSIPMKRKFINSPNEEEPTVSRHDSESYNSPSESGPNGFDSTGNSKDAALYQEFNTTNRSYLWEVYLEKYGSKFDKIQLDKNEVSTMIQSNFDLDQTTCNLPNQSVIASDVMRTKNSIANHKLMAEKMITLF